MIVDFAQLQKLSGLTQVAAVKRWLEKNGVVCMVQPDGKPVTTLDAINRAMYGNSRYNKPDLSPTPCSHRKSTRKMGGITTSTRTNGTR